MPTSSRTERDCCVRPSAAISIAISIRLSVRAAANPSASACGCLCLRRAEERLVAREQRLHHRDADGVRQREARERRGEGLADVRADARSVQVRELHQLEREQRQRQHREHDQRRIDAMRREDHRDRPAERGDREQQVEAVGEPRQPARDEVIALARASAARRRCENSARACARRICTAPYAQRKRCFL